MFEQVRVQAIERLAAHAKSLGANSVVPVVFDTSDIGSIMTELLAHGTAIAAEPDPGPLPNR